MGNKAFIMLKIDNILTVVPPEILKKNTLQTINNIPRKLMVYIISIIYNNI